MSQEDVAIVERAVAAINQRDIDGYLACCTDDVELITPLADIAGAYEGADGIRRFFADIADANPDFNLAFERLEAVGTDRVLAFMQLTGSGRASGIPTSAETGNVYDLVDGRIKRIRVFSDREEALEAAGLSE
ncbi:MAG TPA: nuclear transport factor 2 family protein [Solirubrobacterales bacterium]|jgi:ketosteroid isomerase-like protein|nr:nuclear transport factor 2 family protein [Solirubrobacterales bacterium]